MDEDHPEDDEEVDEPYDVERILEVKDNQEVSCSNLVYVFHETNWQSRNIIRTRYDQKTKIWIKIN